ncbi:MAG: ATP-dependent Clp protease ATP-binding subunit ClpX [Ignavibacteriae bacterium]|nr:ATP-dependent Clp protease ATP-binding subunit ClpX [Ignavibacteriota bacterium]MCB9217320.1 ATP-dependent Clp protease ATP-binding subunit ClpX [Ignavibacteria bacterium]
MSNEKGMTGTDLVRCSFCKRSSDEVTSIIAGPEVYICDICVQNSVDLLRQNANLFMAPELQDNLTPSRIKAVLDEYVIGQEYAKKVLSVAVYNHYKRIESAGTLSGFDDVEVEKANIMMLGSTGVGKTLLAKTLAKLLDVPFAMTDATTLTEAGYVGDDVDSILVTLLHNANYDIERAERGIIYIDEIDKITRRSDSPSITRDVAGEGVQQGLLKIIEGTIANVPPKGGRKHPEAPLVRVNTKNILFICGGAFDGLERIIAKRIRTGTMGFGVEVENRVEEKTELFKEVQQEDLLSYGLIPELIGRLPVIAPLEPLSDAALRQILIEPKNAIVRQYKKLFAMEGVDLEFSNEAIEAIIGLAKVRKTGARALRGVVEEAMLEIMYDLPDRQGLNRVVMTPEAILREGKPEYHYAEEVLMSGTE